MPDLTYECVQVNVALQLEIDFPAYGMPLANLPDHPHDNGTDGFTQPIFGAILSLPCRPYGNAGSVVDH